MGVKKHKICRSFKILTKGNLDILTFLYCMQKFSAGLLLIVAANSGLGRQLYKSMHSIISTRVVLVHALFFVLPVA
jgi:hypothetical protein